MTSDRSRGRPGTVRLTAGRLRTDPRIAQARRAERVDLAPELRR